MNDTLAAVALLLAAAAPKAEIPLFPTEAEAERRCPDDIVVWLDTATGVYYFRGQRWHASTPKGAFACKKDADRAGYRRNPTGK
jgi:hypothetical protein